MRRLRRCLPAVLTLAGCAGPDVDPAVPEDDGQVSGRGAEHAALNTPCAYNATTRVMDVTLDAGELLLLTKRTSDSALLVNGVACGLAKATSTTRINILENTSAPGDQSVIIDLSNGIFGTGRGGSVGIDVSFGSGTDSLSIRGGTANDYIVMAADGIATNNDPNADVAVRGSGTISYTVTLGAGNDTFSAMGGVNRLGAPFADAVAVYGGDGADKLTGGAGNDSLFGGNGNDMIAGGLGDDTCSGDAGDDVFDESLPADGSSNGNDTYLDSAGALDLVDYSARTSALRVDVEALGVGTNDDGEVALGEADQLVSGIDAVRGGAGDDVLRGDSGANTLYGGKGSDTLSGGLGADVLRGEAGDDVLDEGNASSGADVLSGGEGLDVVDYGARSNGVRVTMDGKASDDGEASEGDNVGIDIENCYGGAGNDDITGNTLANALRGGGGNDVLRGGDGNDVFDDPLPNNGGDQILGGLGYDRIDYSAHTTALVVTMDGLAADDGVLGEGDNIGTDVEECLGGSGHDSITGGAAHNVIEGGLGNDTLRGGDGNDMLSGGPGNDRLEGGPGEDTLDGETDNGNDVLDCGPGDADIGLNGETVTSCEL